MIDPWGGVPVQPILRGMVLAPYGRDAELMAAALADCGGQPVVCRNLAELLSEIASDAADLLVISYDALVVAGDDRLLSALRERAVTRDDILPV